MSTKPNANPSLTLTLCAIVDVAPAAANTIWLEDLSCCRKLYCCHTQAVGYLLWLFFWDEGMIWQFAEPSNVVL